MSITTSLATASAALVDAGGEMPGWIIPTAIGVLVVAGGLLIFAAVRRRGRGD
ncbi:hypothetical protein [Microbacterium sp. gxy059]|uniref:hypothetical protein n=1 Tax=Microbacterium sp. gxy059 TaxID=2957199 RepID=UPI003D97BCC7